MLYKETMELLLIRERARIWISASTNTIRKIFRRRPARTTVIGRKNEEVKEGPKGRIKFGRKRTQTHSFYYQSCLFGGSLAETTSWHFQLPNENNMFVWEKNKLYYSHFNTVNSGLILA